MFIGFDLHIEEQTEFFRNGKGYSYYVRLGEMHLEKQIANYKEDLKAYITSKEIDGTKIQEEWFPEIEADIFISHSHEDKDLACALAGWLYDTFKLKCFIDSCVWGDSKELLELMNSELSNKRVNEKGGYFYNHDSCNRVSQHVNVMLSIALQKMIDKVETVMVLNTDNAIRICSNTEMNETYSPWIYSEIIASQLIQKKPLITYRNYSRKYYRSDSIAMSESMQYAMNISISYKVSLAHLRKLQEIDLVNWSEQYCEKNDCEYSLDVLYEQICPGEVCMAQKMSSMLGETELCIIRQLYNGTCISEEERQQLEHSMQKVISRCFYPCQECDKILIGAYMNKG